MTAGVLRCYVGAFEDLLCSWSKAFIPEDFVVREVIKWGVE
jgi:hypothetical protein